MLCIILDYINIEYTQNILHPFTLHTKYKLNSQNINLLNPKILDCIKHIEPLKKQR